MSIVRVFWALQLIREGRLLGIFFGVLRIFQEVVSLAQFF